MGISIFSPLLVTINVLGILLLIDSEVLTDSSITLSSTDFPISKNEIINAPVSRNILFSPADETSSAGKIEINRELKLPKEINVSILKSRFLIFL